MRRATIPLLLLSALAGPAGAQQAGWQYSPLPREGDRAAMGCASGSTASSYACLVVRCEDDFTVGLHLHSSRADGDAGRWRLDIDKDSFALEALADETAPYGARVSGDPAAIIDGLKQGAVAFLDPADGGVPPPGGPIPLSGSLTAINQALYFCAPRTPPVEPAVTP